MNLVFVFIVEKAAVKYCSKEFPELLPFISELRRNRKRRNEETGENGNLPRRWDNVCVFDSISKMPNVYEIYALNRKFQASFVVNSAV